MKSRLLWPLRWLPLIGTALSLFAARPALAQHYDVSFNAGVSKRFMSGGSLEGSTGPIIGLAGDIALAPLFRFGVYLDEELAYDGEPKSPYITTVGGRIKFLPPLGSDKVKAWIFVGFGYGALIAPSYTQTIGPTADNQSANQQGTALKDGGSFLEIPFGLGASYKLREPWVVLAELCGRAAVSSSGSYFDPTGRPAVTASGESTGLVTGEESFAIIFTVGIGIDL